MKQINPWQAVACVLIVAIVAVFSLRFFGQPVAATIQVPTQVTFHGNSLQVEGTVKADCHCELEVSIEKQPVTVGLDGKFKAVIPIDVFSNEGGLKVTALTHGRYFKFLIETATATVNYTRDITPCTLSSPLQWGKNKMDVYIKCTSGVGNVTTDAGVPYPSDANSQSGPGYLIVSLPFDNSYKTASSDTKVTVTADGYAPEEFQLTTKNMNYDANRVVKDAEQAADEQAQLASIQPYKEAIQRSSDQLLGAMKSLRSSISNVQKTYSYGAYAEDNQGIAKLTLESALAYKQDVNDARRQIQDAEDIFNSINVVPNKMKSLNSQWKSIIQRFELLPDQLENVITTFANGQEERAVQMAETQSDKWLQLFADAATLNGQIQSW